MRDIEENGFAIAEDVFTNEDVLKLSDVQHSARIFRFASSTTRGQSTVSPPKLHPRSLSNWTPYFSLQALGFVRRL